MNKKEVAVYSRLSVKSEMLIQERQTRLIEIAQKNGSNTPICYVDNGFLGTDFVNRQGLNALLSDIDDDKISTVIVTSLSELSRDLVQMRHIVNEIFVSKGVSLIVDQDKNFKISSDEEDFCLIMG